MGWETSHRKRNIDQVDLEGIDRDRRRILSGYGTSSKGYSKRVEELFKDIPDDAMVSVRDILGEMPDIDDDDILMAVEQIDKEVTPQERRDMLETTKDVREMSEEELGQYYADQADKEFNDRLDAVMHH